MLESWIFKGFFAKERLRGELFMNYEILFCNFSLILEKSQSCCFENISKGRGQNKTK